MSDDYDLTSQVTINKQVTINGNNHVLNGQNITRIFYITGNNVVLNNIIFKNGNITGNVGGAIYWYNGVNGTVSNCSFINNTAGTNGGAVYWRGVNGTVSNCSFINNTVRTNGGAVYWNNGVNGTVSNCSFSNNTVRNSGGAVYWDNGVNGTVSNCSFSNNTAFSNGGAVYWSGGNGTVSNCSFSNNTVSNSGGGAVSWNGEGGKIYESNFINNTAITNQSKNIDSSVNLNVSDCNFTMNDSLNITYSGADVTVNGYSGINYNIATVNSVYLDDECVNNTLNIPVNNSLDYTFTPSSGGIHITFSDNKNNYYYYFNVTAEITLNDTYEITINTITPIVYGDTITVNVTLPYNATGNVTITINNESKEAQINDGNASANFTDVPVGTYTINVTYNGNGEYAPKNNNTTITINKSDTVNLTINSMGVLKYGDAVPVNVTVQCNHISPDARVNITIDGVSLNADLTLFSGGAYANATFYNGFNASTHNITVKYYNDTNYNDKTENSTFTIEQLDVYDLIVRTVNVSYGDVLLVNVTVPVNATGNITVTVDGRSYTARVVNTTAYNHCSKSESW